MLIFPLCLGQLEMAWDGKQTYVLCYHAGEHRADIEGLHSYKLPMEVLHGYSFNANFLLYVERWEPIWNI